MVKKTASMAPDPFWQAKRRRPVGLMEANWQQKVRPAEGEDWPEEVHPTTRFRL
ncbi:MAG TPA: hypothetical protein PLO14_10480 [Accumulibacter sp.]|uniref:hypothetical protein n=1 Tax=Accumulibacter sp. TaxID=2053492 RepID=UPI0025D053CC|nr:hypothetical protein [Accumulibacter sp.]MCM8597240.1 hypothetical protein [Accumulibacter sp.]HNC52647.1 hypothetical protein [Accumulibacter sp.]